MLLIRFCFNPVSLDEHGHAVEGGQAWRLVHPILEHLGDAEWSIGGVPHERAVNVYYAHRSTFTKVRRETAVFVSHGIADKGWRNTTGPYYRASFVSGPAWTVRLLDYKAQLHTVFEVGYPKLDPLYRARQERIRANPARPEVLWAPTHGGGGMNFAFSPTAPPSSNAKRSSWWQRTDILDLLATCDVDVVESPHPRHRADRQATFDEYLTCDVVIGDGGSSIYEAWALGIPVVFLDWITREGNTQDVSRGTMEHTIYADQIGRHAQNPAQLAGLLHEAATCGMTPAEADFIEPVLPAAYRGIGGRMHAETLLDLAAGVPAPRHQARVDFVTYTFAGRDSKVVRGSKSDRRLSRNPNWHVK